MTMMVSFRKCARAFSPTTAAVLLHRNFRSTLRLDLNRLLFDPTELDPPPTAGVDAHEESTVTVTIPKDDYRTIHAAKILGLHNGDTVRAGVVLDETTETHPAAGLVTDTATVLWKPEGKVKTAAPLAKSGDPPGSLQLTLHDLGPPTAVPVVPPVSLILAVPRPLQLNRLLPMICQLGVDHLVLTAAAKVPRDYFGSHLLRHDRARLRRAACTEGLCQAGVDVRVPRITVVRHLRHFLQHDLDALFPVDRCARVLAHPQRRRDTEDGTVVVTGRFDDNVQFPAGDRRIVVAVGPEGGWQEPEELDMLTGEFGFQTVTLGPRVLRSDVAVVALLALAHEACQTTTPTPTSLGNVEDESSSSSL